MINYLNKFEMKKKRTLNINHLTMDRTPSQIYEYLCTYTDSNGDQLCNRSGGNRFSFYMNGKVIVNHIVPTSKAKNARGYILLKHIPEKIKKKYSEEFKNAGKTSIGICHFNFKQLHHIMDNIDP